MRQLPCSGSLNLAADQAYAALFLRAHLQNAAPATAKGRLCRVSPCRCAAAAQELQLHRLGCGCSVSSSGSGSSSSSVAAETRETTLRDSVSQCIRQPSDFQLAAAMAAAPPDLKSPDGGGEPERHVCVGKLV
jgi:hypothetical protein